MKIIYVFRHGQTDWNKEGRIQGHLDVPLNEEGRGQAARLGPVLARLGVEAFFSSDLSRASDTARIAGESFGNRIYHTDPRLREIFLGVLQGKTRAEIERDHGVHLSNRLMSGPLGDADVAAIGSESGRQVYERALEAILEFYRRHPYSRVGIATHGGMLRRLIQYSIEKEEFPAPIPNGIVYPFEVDLDQGRLRFPGFTKLVG